MLSDSGDELTGPGLPTELPKGPCRSSRWSKGDGNRGHGGQALAPLQVALRTSAFTPLEWRGSHRKVFSQRVM